MIEKFFTQPKTLSRLHAGLLGPHLSAVAEALEHAQFRLQAHACICGLPTTSGPGFKRRTLHSSMSVRLPSTATSEDWAGKCS